MTSRRRPLGSRCRGDYGRRRHFGGRSVERDLVAGRQRDEVESPRDIVDRPGRKRSRRRSGRVRLDRLEIGRGMGRSRPWTIDHAGIGVPPDRPHPRRRAASSDLPRRAADLAAPQQARPPRPAHERDKAEDRHHHERTRRGFIRRSTCGSWTEVAPPRSDSRARGRAGMPTRMSTQLGSGCPGPPSQPRKKAAPSVNESNKERPPPGLRRPVITRLPVQCADFALGASPDRPWTSGYTFHPHVVKQAAIGASGGAISSGPGSRSHGSKSDADRDNVLRRLAALRVEPGRRRLDGGGLRPPPCATPASPGCERYPFEAASPAMFPILGARRRGPPQAPSRPTVEAVGRILRFAHTSRRFWPSGSTRNLIALDWLSEEPLGPRRSTRSCRLSRRLPAGPAESLWRVESTSSKGRAAALALGLSGTMTRGSGTARSGSSRVPR